MAALFYLSSKIKWPRNYCKYMISTRRTCTRPIAQTLSTRLRRNMRRNVLPSSQKNWRLRLLSRLILILCLTLGTAPFARASECTEAQDVSEPCSGVLVPRDQALEAIRDHVDLPLCLLNLKETIRIYSEKVTQAEGQIAAESARADGYAKLVKEAPSRTTWFMVGAGTVLVVVLTVILVRELK